MARENQVFEGDVKSRCVAPSFEVGRAPQHRFAGKARRHGLHHRVEGLFASAAALLGQPDARRFRQVQRPHAMNELRCEEEEAQRARIAIAP